jgi:uncharacterized protein (TIGR00369 family)
MTAHVPEGFTLLRPGGRFLSSLGPLYLKGEAVVAIRIAAPHLNTRGVAHGGMLVTLADSAMGIVIARLHDPPQPMVTINLTADFAEAAREGDWVEARVELQKVGRRLAFASCRLWVGEKSILRASGIFTRVTPAKREGPFEG